MRFEALLVTAGLALAPVIASAAQTEAAPQALIAGTAGTWRGELQYRDYQSNRWQGLPMSMTIAAQPDGVTTVRTEHYDDGPQTGIVTITTVTLVDPAAKTASYAIFRRLRDIDTGLAQITRVVPGADDRHWTIVTSERRKDGDQMAQVRETTIRNGAVLTTLKEVNPDGDGADAWLPRNRSVLTAVPVPK